MSSSFAITQDASRRNLSDEEVLHVIAQELSVKLAGLLGMMSANGGAHLVEISADQRSGVLWQASDLARELKDVINAMV